MTGALALLILQWTGYWVDYNDDYSTGLQFAAKVHELAMQASVIEILLYLVRAGLVDSLVPLGALSGAMQATQLSYLWSLDFFAVARTKALRGRQKMIFVLAMPGLISLVSLVGPSSAVLMIPRAESLRVADNITMHSYGSKERLYPANIIAADLQLDLDVPQFKSSLLNTYGYEVAGTGPSFQKETARSVVYTDPNVDYNRVIRFSRNFDPDHLESNSTMPTALIVNGLKFASGRTWEGSLKDFSISVVASHPVVSVLCRTQKFLEEHAIDTDLSYFKDDKISLDVLQDLRGISAESQEIECDAERQFWFNPIWVTSPEVGSNSSIVILLGGNSEVLTPSGCVLLEDLKAILDKANGTRNVNLQAKVCTVSSYWNTGEIKLVRMHEDILVTKTGRSSTTRLPDARPFSLDFDQVRGSRHQSFNQLVGTPRDSASGEHWPDTLSAALTVAISQIPSKGLNVQNFLTLDWTPGTDYTPFTFITTESGFGYGTRSTSVYLAMAVLSAYCIITLAYLAYTLITGTASTAWNSSIELFTLALQSLRPGHLGHTSVGIDSIKTCSEGVGVRVNEKDELEIVFANNKDFEKRGLRKVKRNKEY